MLCWFISVILISGWIGENKLITFLSICLFSFVIATIALASQKSSLEDQLATCTDSLKPTPAPDGSSTTPQPPDSSTQKNPDNVMINTKKINHQHIFRKQANCSFHLFQGDGEPGKPTEPLKKRMMDVLSPKFLN